MTNKILNKVLLRSFFLQATWNYERMQNLGFCFSILPALKKIYSREEELKKAISRHLEFFNTHPYMASPILGAVTRMEEEVAKKTVSGEDVNSFKDSIMGAYGAMGDTFFWESLKPMTAVISVCLAAFDITLAPLVFLLMYNIPHLKTRIFGFYTGYREGLNIFEIIKAFNYTSLSQKLKIIISCCSGLLLAIIITMKVGDSLTGKSFFDGIIYLCFLSALFFVYKKGVSTTLLIYISFIVCVGSAFLYN